jgi:hypothetical protein
MNNIQHIGENGESESLIIELPTGRLTLSANLRDVDGVFDLIQLSSTQAAQQCTAGNDFVRVVRRCRGLRKTKNSTWLKNTIDHIRRLIK